MTIKIYNTKYKIKNVIKYATTLLNIGLIVTFGRFGYNFVNS